MSTYDFDHTPSRSGSGSCKWDRYPGAIPLWVADMDFPAAPCIMDALRRRIDHGVFGYTHVRDEYYSALTGWFLREHGYEFSREDVIYIPGVVPALSAIIKALVPVGNGVIVMTPVYNCFFSSVCNNGCEVVECPLEPHPAGDGEFSYSIDFPLLEELASDPRNSMLILCNPHNPGGRVWTVEEMTRVRDICRSHGVQVLSDEIHCELTMPGYKYTPYGILDPEAVVCVAPTKAFNIAGLQIANIVCGNPHTLALVNRAVNINEVCDVNPLGVEALIAAYTPDGKEWLDAVKAYLAANWQYTRDLLREQLPQCPLARLEATYLPWLDVSSLGVTGSRLADMVERECNVKVNSGAMYGDDRYIRLNIACSRSLLDEALTRIIAVIKSRL
ncbi:MalY/PatB family protein [Duncaniella freteri]|uniref:MalY/PatB family protein n=1 Tax=Duncaniella freteri TaxID=2530391 RepID=UPI002577313D|nr:MalY/PatB family protein [Duncaniella freteri]